MPNYHPFQFPTPKKLTDPGVLEEKFKTYGIDYALFGKFVRELVDPDPTRMHLSTFQAFFKKPDGKLYSKDTFKSWIKAYRSIRNKAA